MSSDEPIEDVIARVERYRTDPPGSDGYRDSGESQRDAERLLDTIRELVADTVDDPRKLGGEIAGPGGAMDFGGVVLDARHAILVESQEVCKVDPEHGARGNDEMFAFLFAGRINQTIDRAKVMLFGDLDFMAAIVTEIHGVAERAGPEYQRKLHRLCEDRWREMPHR